MMAPAANIELAYETWCSCGQNLIETARALAKAHGFDVTRQTLAEWRDKYDWQGRAARAEVEAREQKSAISDDALIGSLLDQKNAYEKYFKSLPFGHVDVQATYGYNSVLKTLIDIRQSSGAFKTEIFGRFFRDLVEFLRANDPMSMDVVMRNFDDFSAFVRAKYVG